MRAGRFARPLSEISTEVMTAFARRLSGDRAHGHPSCKLRTRPCGGERLAARRDRSRGTKPAGASAAISTGLSGPLAVTEPVAALCGKPKICRQYPPFAQSGSNTVLKRMNRKVYDEYLHTLALLRQPCGLRRRTSSRARAKRSRSTRRDFQRFCRGGVCADT